MNDPAPLILVADDQKPTVTMLERVFSYEGYRVESVYDGLSAVEKARSLLPDLILLDINMPLMNGLDVLKELRQQPITAQIPAILITAMGDITHVVKGLNLGADDYIRKPFHPQELLARAQSKMKARALEVALQEKTRETEILLRVSEELNQYLEVDKIIDFMLYMTLDLIPCEVAFVFLLDEIEHHVVATHCRTKDGEIVLAINTDIIVHQIVQTEQSFAWDNRTNGVSDYDNGLVVPLHFREGIRAIIGIMGRIAYDQSHKRLLTGLGRQASLALQNAELHSIKVNYAEDLERQVAKRTEELESTQRMLVQSEKLASIGRLSAAIAHEINNPLLPIKLDLEGILEDLRANMPIDPRDVEHILENVDRIGNTVENLLGFTGNRKADSARFSLVDMNHIISGIIKLNHKLMQQDNVKVEADFAPLPQIYGNRYQLEYVFMNLMLNARDAMPDGGKVIFHTIAHDDRVIITVSDTGTGIPENMIDTIFEPFMSTKETGNGLGLYISHDILQKHNAEIHVDSKINKGTTFTIVFMIKSEQIIND